ncbi:MAG: metallophosphoesterase [Campylobacteraceae bacterium]|jgi:predicted MPP superfamily phosphohydrolase|nr:metallophosphoesterase [Campylobacteraceae bacterium]
MASAVIFAINLFSFICLFCRVEFFKARGRIVIAVILLIVTALEVYYLTSFRRGGDDIFMLQFTAALIGISFILFFFSLLYFILRVPLFIIPFSKERRQALKFILDITIFIAAFSWVLKGLAGGFGKPIRRKVAVKIDSLSTPLSIAHITDAHIGKVLGKEFMQEVVNGANELDADIVVITGDLVDMSPKYVKEKLEPLKKLKSRYGVYYVLGNHEYFDNVAGVVELIKSFGIRVLNNENVIIDGRINLAGINDIRGERFSVFKPDIKKTLSGRDMSLPTLLLSHQPKVVEKITDEDRVDLIVSGHTHGGQIFPFGFLVLLDQPYLYGLYQHSPVTQVFVSSGVGYWGPPLRILAPSEIVKLELKG